MLLYLDLAYQQPRRTWRLASLDELRDAIKDQRADQLGSYAG